MSIVDKHFKKADKELQLRNILKIIQGLSEMRGFFNSN